MKEMCLNALCNLVMGDLKSIFGVLLFCYRCRQVADSMLNECNVCELLECVDCCEMSLMCFVLICIRTITNFVITANAEISITKLI